MKARAFIVFVAAALAAQAAVAAGPQSSAPSAYYSPALCRNCHAGIYKQYSESMHAASYTNPVFQAQYFHEVLPLVKTRPSLSAEAAACIACHDPVAFIERKGAVDARGTTDPRLDNVICDFCHSIDGYTGRSPGNGNYVSTPDETKRGPYQCTSCWHQKYAEFQGTSEFCAICHNQVNQTGLEIKATYTEWKQSEFPGKGIRCQNCHMNVLGYLWEGVAYYQRGRAATPAPAVSAAQGGMSAPYRSRIYTHRFPGAHSRSAVVGSLGLDIIPSQQAVKTGDLVTVTVRVDNSRSGHKMPSGSAELRLLWIELRAYSMNGSFDIPASSAVAGAAWDVSGMTEADRKLIGTSVPPNQRLYRAIIHDSSNNPTLSSYVAAKIAFDNRLKAGEVREETYSFTVPQNAKDRLYLMATLNYLPYTEGFARQLGIKPAEPVEIANDTKVLAVK